MESGYLYRNIRYFSGLGALRFFAAFLVVMHHAESIRLKYQLPHLSNWGLFQSGKYAVTFFFVLSGFLITYLLLQEHRKTKNIDISSFYMRRILRIWPLYFLLIFIGFLVPYVLKWIHFPYEMPYTWSETWFYFLFFMPGLVTFYFGSSLLEPLWSIGVEEVFYLFWAPLFSWLRKYLLYLLLGILGIKLLLLTVNFYYSSSSDLYNYLLYMLQFESMAIGGLGAYFIYNRKKTLQTLWIYKPYVQMLVYGFLLVFLLGHRYYSSWQLWLTHPLFLLLINMVFLYLIIGVAMIDKSVIRLRANYLEFLGNISYGIYMYHLLVIFAVILLGKPYLLQMPLWVASMIYYLVVATGVIIVAYVSKKYFENFFLKFKGILSKK